MGFRLPNDVQETSTTTGTGTLTLAGAVANFLAFSSQCAAGDTVFYSIYDSVNVEAGIGTIGGSGPYTLSRDTVIYSTNGNAKVNWAAGTRNVGCMLPGEAVAGLLDPSLANGVLRKIGARQYSTSPLTARDQVSVASLVDLAGSGATNDYITLSATSAGGLLTYRIRVTNSQVPRLRAVVGSVPVIFGRPFTGIGNRRQHDEVLRLLACFEQADS
jgi:hypothetical protein